MSNWKINQKDLCELLEKHKLWVVSGGNEGIRGYLSNCKIKRTFTNLTGAELSSIDLRNTELVGVDLTGANLKSADLRYSDFRDADLTNACLESADLEGTNFVGAKLDRGIVQAWTIYGARFSPDALPWLMLRPNWTKERDHVHICEM
jgi:uncharacterized protein YjbI with pentapeptide repeats